MKPVRFISTSVALTYDSHHDVVIKVVRAVDTKGRSWEQYDDGPYVPIASPFEPAKPNRKLGRTSR